MTAPRPRSRGASTTMPSQQLHAQSHGLGLATAPPPERQNFRQVGAKPTGSVARGNAPPKHAPHSTDPQQRVASIPSKYETVLHRDAPERNAFGARTNRFGENENELPGPGSYYTRPSLVKTAVDSGSVSRLGYSTGFVSKTKRFSDRVRDIVPGPGQYQPTHTDDRMKPQNRKVGMSSFATTSKPVLNNQALAAAADAPGPGDYDTAQTSSALAHNIARSAFASKVARGFAPSTDSSSGGNAGPGQYDNPLQLSQQHRHAAAVQSSVFRSASKRLEPPPATSFATPGPGAYNAADAEAALRYDRVAKAHSSAAFQTSTLDRFGRAPGRAALDTELGPGSYRVESLAEALDRKAGSSNVFKSKTTRTDAGGGGTAAASASGCKTSTVAVPGPAFYHPSSPGKHSSHLLNANKKWL